ncbi:hypothetical protein WDZ16_12990 [Pseudokineococcus marinus]|uniref:phage portal protein family protein n=1 Tax=Pseudokineococcus marinus TaxID=351215 RepID=UPI001BB17E8D|nr:hypothetical protein [Pseudokineococcus marinus]
MARPTVRASRVAGHRPAAIARPRAAVEPAPPVVAAPTSEVGYALSSTSWWSALLEEETPELRWPQAVQVYDRMRKQDGQVRSVLRAVTMPLQRTRWYVDPNGADPAVVQLVAEDLGLPVGMGVPGEGAGPATTVPRSRDRFSWPQHLQEALLCLPFGHSFFEQVYRIDGQGRARLRKLAPRLPRTLSAINVASDGGLVSIEQQPPADRRGRVEKVVIPVDRLVAYVNEREGGDWRGTSMLRAAYKHWLIKDRLIRTQAQMIDRNGMGVPLYKAASALEEELTAGRKLATQWRSGLTAGAAVPADADLVLRGVEGDLPDAMAPIRYHDEQIGRTALGHFLNLGQQTGSWALGSTFADFFTLSLQTVAMQIADIANQHVVEDLVDLNFGPDAAVPLLRFDEIGSRNAATADAIKWLVDAGVVFPDRELEEFVRTTFGLPPKALPPAPTEGTTS